MSKAGSKEKIQAECKADTNAGSKALRTSESNAVECNAESKSESKDESKAEQIRG